MGRSELLIKIRVYSFVSPRYYYVLDLGPAYVRLIHDHGLMFIGDFLSTGNWKFTV